MITGIFVQYVNVNVKKVKKLKNRMSYQPLDILFSLDLTDVVENSTETTDRFLLVL